MDNTIIKTNIPASEYRVFEMFLFDNGFISFSLHISVNLKVVVIFSLPVEAILYELKCIEQYFNDTDPFYLEPDVDFEMEFEKMCGVYNEFDDVTRLHKG